jgi:hypothetical protein
MDNNGRAHRRRGPSPEPRRNPSIDSEPEVILTNQKHRDEALAKKNTSVLSDFANDAQIESNSSPELSLELEPPRTSTGNSGNCESNVGKPFRDLEMVRQEGSSIYLLLGFEDIFVLIPFLKLK